MQADRKRGVPREDERNHRAILALVLAGFPVPRTLPELTREIGDKEAVNRAVYMLMSYGLIEYRTGSVLPTPAAVHCHRLDAW
jgi:hypothetical protein